MCTDKFGVAWLVNVNAAQVNAAQAGPAS
jgi:uncharacterized glyoxalase superfamily protein PhnB